MLRPVRMQTYAYTHTGTHKPFRGHAQRHIHPDMRVYPGVSAHWCTHTHTDIIAHMLRPRQLHAHMFARGSTFISVCTHSCTHEYTHTDLPLYTRVHMGPDMLAYPDPSAHHRTPTYIQTQSCTCIYRRYPVRYTHLHIGPHSRTRMHVYMPLCTHSHTGSPLLSVLSNQEFTGRPLVSSHQAGSASPPCLSPPPPP